jgi:hypothetical protein
VRVVDSVTGKQQILGGRLGMPGFEDGNSNSSRFYEPHGLALSLDEKTLYVCDQENSCIRSIDTANGVTRTFTSSESSDRNSLFEPKCCDWDRASDVEPFTFLFICAAYAIGRLNVKTGEMTIINLKEVHPLGIVCLSGSGIVVISGFQTRCLWTVDPRTAKMERLTGAEATQSIVTEPDAIEWGYPCGLAWYERDQSVLVADSNANCVFRVPIPDHLLMPRSQSAAQS